MPEFDAESESEQREAIALRELLQGGKTDSNSVSVETGELHALARLTQITTEQWVPERSAVLRQELLRTAQEHAERRARTSAGESEGLVWKKWWAWFALGVPACAALLLTLRFSSSSMQQAEPMAQSPVPEQPAARAAGGPAELMPSESDLLRAQAQVLAARVSEADGKESNIQLKEAWSDYRGRLIAQLEEE